MSKLLSMREAVAKFVPDGTSVAMGLQMEQMIPFAAGQEIIRQKKSGLTLIGPISDILFEQIIVSNMTNFSIALALQAGAMGVPYLPTRTALGSDVSRNNDSFREIHYP